MPDLRFRRYVLLGVSAAAILAASIIPAVPQNPDYHRFAGPFAPFGIPGFWNAVSSLPFLLIGVYGIADLSRGSLRILPEFRYAYLAFFLALALTGPGSAYYHLVPDNASLVWDRLPMTLAFMSLLAIFLAERVSLRAAQRLFWPLLLAGVASVVYWHAGETRGHGDLRPYAVIQFLSILLIVLILSLFPPRFSGRGYAWAMIGVYAAAKLAEILDHAVYERLRFITGHNLKHLLAALAVYLFLLGLRRRQRLPEDQADTRFRW